MSGVSQAAYAFFTSVVVGRMGRSLLGRSFNQVLMASHTELLFVKTFDCDRALKSRLLKLKVNRREVWLFVLTSDS